MFHQSNVYRKQHTVLVTFEPQFANIEISFCEFGLAIIFHSVIRSKPSDFYSKIELINFPRLKQAKGSVKKIIKNLFLDFKLLITIYSSFFNENALCSFVFVFMLVKIYGRKLRNRRGLKRYAKQF